MRYYVIKVKGNDERVLNGYDRQEDAILRMNLEGSKNDFDRYVYAVILGDLDDRGRIKNRRHIAVYNKWARCL